MIETLIVDRMFRQASVCAQPELKQIVMNLLEGAKEGHLCSFVDQNLVVPDSLCSSGDAIYPITPLVKQANRLYLQKNWAFETLIRNKVVELVSRVPAGLDFDRFKADLEEMSSLQEAQVKALYRGFEKSLAIFTGGPGTGKTYTAGCFIRLLANQGKRNYKVAIAAPTGKAAAHLEQALQLQGPLPAGMNYESTTLHRLLKLRPGSQKLYSDWKIDADLVVVDEASMLDPSLMLHLFNAIGPATRLLLLGDPDQLPPVDGGSLFPDIAAIFGQKLERSMRLGEGELYLLSQAILEENVEQIVHEPLVWETVFDRVCEIIPNPIYDSPPDPRYCLEEQKRFRFLCALRQGPFGVDSLNQKLLTRFKKKGGFFAIPILITQNDPKQQLYNGTTGVLIRNQAYFLFGEELRMIPEGALPRYEPAFFLSIHKSQGSEFNEVVAIFPPGSDRFGKAALYTAVTRAKIKATLWIDELTLAALMKVSGKKRSGFSERLR